MSRNKADHLKEHRFERTYDWGESCNVKIGLRITPSMKKALDEKGKEWTEFTRKAISTALGKEKEQQESKEKKIIPLYACPVSAGTPQPTEDYLEGEIDIAEYLISDQSNIFSVRASGDSMIGAGINNNDILIVDRSINPTDGKIIVAILNGELLVKRFELKDEKVLFSCREPSLLVHRSN